MTEDIGELGDVLLNAVERAGKKMSQVMRKHFARVDIRVPAKLFHFTPYIRSVDGLARLGDKNHAVADMMPLCIFQQLFLQAADDDDHP